jgi:glycosyltransferase involved in cell wall biosynthesis
MSNHAIRVLLELRPALGGHAGIPQANRLLFRGLSLLDGVRVTGLLQSSGRVLAKGLPGGPLLSLSTDQQLNRLARVVISLEQGLWGSRARTVAHTAAMALWHLFGGSQELTHFDPIRFKDFVWRRLFARTLVPEDLERVTRASYRVARVPWVAMHLCGLITKKLGYALYPRLDTSDFDVMIAETPYPATVSARTKLVVRYHDAIPLLMPDTISDRRFHQAAHYRALRRNVHNGAWFACVSEATRNDLLSVFPEVENRCVTIHNMVSHHYFNEESSAERVWEVIGTRRATRIKHSSAPQRSQRALSGDAQGVDRLDYLLTVSTIEPRKNHLTLLSAWERLRLQGHPGLKLLIVGDLGWHHAAILRKFRQWMERGDAILLEDVAPAELRLLYKHARATVCPSFGEGFGLSGVEAMACGGSIVASDTPAHREIYLDAAEYFNPYSTDDMFQALRRVINRENTAYRDALIRKGTVVVRRYSHEAILQQWESFLRGQVPGAASFELDACKQAAGTIRG